MPIPLDCLILGGGIAGLWTLRVLLGEGYDAALVETAALGSVQTIASQAILHAGTKYALTGHAAGASKAAGQAAGIWRACLRGGASEAPCLDLASTAILSPHTCMFTTPGVASRLTGLAASRALATGPQRLTRPDFPPAFADAPPGVDVYRLDEPVVDLPSLINTLAGPARSRLIHARAVALRWDDDESPEGKRRATARITTDAGDLTFHPRALVCTAGAGNEQLLGRLDLAAEVPMQRRPLHMVLARTREPGVPGLPHLHAHCITLSDKPRATITTATDAVGRTIWYIGGQLAETGVSRSREQQIAAAREELARILPWVAIAGVQFATHRVDRAEGFDRQGRRPDTPVVRRHDTVIACWPTKLVLAPLAAEAVRDRLTELSITPAASASSTPGLPLIHLPFAISPPPTATPLWDREDLQWS